MSMSKLYSAAALAALMFTATEIRTDLLQFKPGDLAQIPLAAIRANPQALRQVDKDKDTYRELVGSIQQTGVLSAVSVRPAADPETGTPYYELIDGLHRYMASLDAGKRDDGTAITTIPAQVISMSDSKVLEAQIIANIHKIETSVLEYRQQLIRILQANPTMTDSELAKAVRKSPQWIGQILGLGNLKPEFAAMVNSGLIPLSNAVALSKLPQDEQPNFSDRASSMLTAQFGPLVYARKSELDKARRAGSAAAQETFNPVPHYQRIGEATAEMNSPKILVDLVNKYAGGDLTKAAQLGLQWAMNMDPDTLAARKVDWEADQAKKSKEKAARDEERAKKKAEAEAKKTAAVQTKANEIKTASAPAVGVAAPAGKTAAGKTPVAKTPAKA